MRPENANRGNERRPRPTSFHAHSTGRDGAGAPQARSESVPGVSRPPFCPHIFKEVSVEKQESELPEGISCPTYKLASA